MEAVTKTKTKIHDRYDRIALSTSDANQKNRRISR